MNPHTALYTVEELRRLESLAAPACGAPLMERAGRAAAEFALRLTAHDAARPILIACGPGNNGGDGFVMARLLREAGRQVTLAFHGDVTRLSEDARAAYSAWWQAGGREVATLPAMPAEGWALAVDALFGIGLTRDIAEPWADWIARMNALPCPRLALDIPSGLFADTGCAGATTFRATHTLTFLTHKPGCHTADGPDCCGQLQLATLDVDAPTLLPAGAHLICRGRLGRALPARRANSHKGDYGTVALAGGARGMVGALWLAARAALMLGSGRVLAAALGNDAPPVDPNYPEIMTRAPDALPDIATVLAIGPGLGQSEEAVNLLTRLLSLEQPLPLVLDADALNLIAADASLVLCLAARGAIHRGPCLLTPHPAEAARLLECDTAAVQRDRIGAARKLAQKFRAYVLLKGCGSVLAHPDGRWQLNTSGNAALATAGSGDVLTGMIAALLAQGIAPEDALALAAHLHGLAAEALCQQDDGPVGLNAGALAQAARRILNRWLREAQNAAQA